MFENIAAAPDDPILGLIDLFNADKRPKKINLGIGVYKDETGVTPILTSVKKVEQYIIENENTKDYLGINGISKFASCTQEQLFGKDSSIISDKRARTAQTPGGTAALRVAADFLVNNTSVKRVWISNPSWPNHKSVFASVGLEVCEYTYHNTEHHSLDFDRLLASLRAQMGDVVLFHGCCHNPTGIDLTLEQWNILAKLSIKKGWLPLFDFAYQGLAHGLEEDARGLRVFATTHHELIVASSYSKNFSLYNERVGACTLVASNTKTIERSFSQIKSVIRANYSSPPAHGALIVVTILSNRILRSIWEQELNDMRYRIKLMRKLFVNTLAKQGINKNFSFIIKQNGMFSCILLTKEQVNRLRKEFAIYITNSGRINIACMTSNNMELICEAIATVM